MYAWVPGYVCVRKKNARARGGKNFCVPSTRMPGYRKSQVTPKPQKKKLYVSPEGEPFEQRIGSRVLVKRGTAYMTPGGLTADGIVVTKDGRYVAKSRHEHGMKHGLAQFARAGYKPFQKGQVGVVSRVTKSKSKSKSKA